MLWYWSLNWSFFPLLINNQIHSINLMETFEVNLQPVSESVWSLCGIFVVYLSIVINNIRWKVLDLFQLISDIDIVFSNKSSYNNNGIVFRDSYTNIFWFREGKHFTIYHPNYDIHVCKIIYLYFFSIQWKRFYE